MFGMVLQNTWLFEGTVAENIAYGKKEATREEIIEAAKMAQCDHFIRTLSEGYDTIISSENGSLSQGQQQLLTIARVILANPPVVILDEATSSVDTRTEVEIQTAMQRITENRTSFVIAHRLSTIEKADLILVMDQGTIVEQGNHAELLQQNGLYAQLHQSQFKE
jgi:ATP-binding cassette subfamily B protein